MIKKNNKLSYSAVEKFLECPKKYDIYYNQKIRERKTPSAFIFGTAFGDALTAFFDAPSDKPKVKGTPREIFDSLMEKQQINGIVEDIKISENVRFLKSDWDIDVLSDDDIKEIENEPSIMETLGQTIRGYEGNLYMDVNESIKRYISWYCLRAKGRLFLETFEKDIKPKIKKVLYTERLITLKNNQGDEFIGYADLECIWEDDSHAIIDFKTASKKYADNAVKESKQLATYYIGCDGTDKIGYIVFEKNIRKKEPKVRIQILIDKPEQSLLQSTYETYDKVNYLVHKGEFPMNKESCKTIYGECSYFKLCHKNSMEGLINTKKDK